MSLVDKDTNVLDDKNEAVVTTPFSETKLLTTEKFTTSDEVHTRTENITTSQEVVKGTDEVHKRTEKITTNEEFEKGTEKLEDMKESVVTICRKDSDHFEGRSKGSESFLQIVTTDSFISSNFSVPFSNSSFVVIFSVRL